MKSRFFSFPGKEKRDALTLKALCKKTTTHICDKKACYALLEKIGRSAKGGCKIVLNTMNYSAASSMLITFTIEGFGVPAQPTMVYIMDAGVLINALGALAAMANEHADRVKKQRILWGAIQLIEGAVAGCNAFQFMAQAIIAGILTIVDPNNLNDEVSNLIALGIFAAPIGIGLTAMGRKLIEASGQLDKLDHPRENLAKLAKRVKSFYKITVAVLDGVIAASTLVSAAENVQSLINFKKQYSWEWLLEYGIAGVIGVFLELFKMCLKSSAPIDILINITSALNYIYNYVQIMQEENELAQDNRYHLIFQGSVLLLACVLPIMFNTLAVCLLAKNKPQSRSMYEELAEKAYERGGTSIQDPEDESQELLQPFNINNQSSNQKRQNTSTLYLG
jgi:hypothetical protein